LLRPLDATQQRRAAVRSPVEAVKRRRRVRREILALVGGGVPDERAFAA
jgi:hypothetical protein